MANKKAKYYGTGKRKTSIARVYITSGKGKITINGKDVKEYMPLESLIQDLSQPLVVTNTESSYNIEVFVKGGGLTGQAGAIRLGIARALLEAGVERAALKSAGLLTRDSRKKERKKYGLKAARRAPQFSKR